MGAMQRKMVVRQRMVAGYLQKVNTGQRKGENT